jgi:hypothetical protein
MIEHVTVPNLDANPRAFKEIPLYSLDVLTFGVPHWPDDDEFNGLRQLGPREKPFLFEFGEEGFELANFKTCVVFALKNRTIIAIGNNQIDPELGFTVVAEVAWCLSIRQ